jgi:hypothetical protein
MQSRRRLAFLGSFVVALILAAGMSVGLISGVSAQATPSASPMAMSGEGHPAHIHTGLCPAPGAVVFPLTNVSAQMASNGTPTAGSAMMGAGSAIPVEASITTVQAKLSDLTDGNHSIVVHESMQNIANYLVCGDIGGMMMGSSDLAIGLGTLNNSGYSGVAWLHDNGDGSTTVTIFLMSSSTGMSGAGATPMAMATPMS